jgi:hypothetical protein
LDLWESWDRAGMRRLKEEGGGCGRETLVMSPPLDDGDACFLLTNFVHIFLSLFSLPSMNEIG